MTSHRIIGRSQYVRGMTTTPRTTLDPTPPVRLLTPEGLFEPTAAAEEYLPYLDRVDDAQRLAFHRNMVLTRAFDHACANLQRQGELGLWVPSHGQEAAQTGSAFAARPQDHLFPSYREHAAALARGVDVLGVAGLLRGVTNSGWDPTDPRSGNVHLYSLVIGTQTLHATGYALGIALDGASGTGDPETDAAALVYYGDGASSQGDVSEAFTFASSFQTPQVFFLQNNQWAISVPVSRQSRTPLVDRGKGWGMPSVQVDGNDVLASYAVTAKHLDDARAGGGPQYIEALTYRIGAHTSSDDPTKYRPAGELETWVARDPIVRFAAYLRGQGVDEDFFTALEREAEDFTADVRRRTLALEPPAAATMFAHAYTDPHPLVTEQAEWLERYEASFDATGATGPTEGGDR
jgi:2-oxoisovalerate dehydrogenase E1 component alpha subunit